MPPSARLTHLVQRVNDNIRFVIPETLFALTIFREQLGIKVVVLFAGVLFTKFFHWVMSVRVDEVHAAVVLRFFFCSPSVVVRSSKSLSVCAGVTTCD